MPLVLFWWHLQFLLWFLASPSLHDPWQLRSNPYCLWRLPFYHLLQTSFLCLCLFCFSVLGFHASSKATSSLCHKNPVEHTLDIRQSELGHLIGGGWPAKESLGQEWLLTQGLWNSHWWPVHRQLLRRDLWAQVNTFSTLLLSCPFLNYFNWYLISVHLYGIHYCNWGLHTICNNWMKGICTFQLFNRFYVLRFLFPFCICFEMYQVL